MSDKQVSMATKWTTRLSRGDAGDLLGTVCLPCRLCSAVNSSRLRAACGRGKSWGVWQSSPRCHQRGRWFRLASAVASSSSRPSPVVHTQTQQPYLYRYLAVPAQVHSSAQTSTQQVAVAAVLILFSDEGRIGRGRLAARSNVTA